ncbi:aminotransferase class I/II-fold pyridoxal phosphate-dependent enzyme [Halococcus agarilyticus]|uniref:aminotransferase class I/II-fold pyridoxal phosphate-dependent enzyme n=1 Tax=Halococcus agarilyticus TaxID=1232219 RepID=UPI0006776C18|nr:aminotransferase class I/II-fold pyridoxal phosphate-dependent enzyme [Halococcus agarilyticus]
MNLDDALGVGRAPHGSSDDPEVVDFSANTNPRVPEGVEAVYRDAFAESRSYPSEPPADYRDAAAEYVDCRADQVVPTPGGLAAIRAVVDLAVSPGDSALVPFPSFGEYAREVRLQGGKPSFVPHDAVLDVDRDDLAENALVIVCNPNNPTGDAYDHDALDGFVARCRDAGTPLLVDEAFLGFTDRPSLAGTPGVVIARSLTKLFGLPGLRAGFAVATGEYEEALTATRRPWDVSGPALSTGAYCMRETEFVAETRERVRSERSRLRDALSAQFDVHSSDAPFLLCDVGERDVDRILEHARNRGLALRDARTFRGLDSHIRVAVRLPAENDRLIEVLGDV